MIFYLQFKGISGRPEMTYTNNYESPPGSILLAGDEEGLTGLWFTEGGRHK